MAASEAESNEPTLVTNFQNCNSEKEKLIAFTNAVNTGLIYKGMEVRSLDKIIGSDFANHLPLKKSEEMVSKYSFGNSSDSWYLITVHNGNGRVLGFCLSNASKGGINPDKAKLSIKQIATEFQNANSVSEKIACTIKSMQSLVVRKGTKKTTLFSIFGHSAQEKRVYYYVDALVSSFELGTAKDSWRLITVENRKNDYIFDYELTNFEFKSWIKRFCKR